MIARRDGPVCVGIDNAPAVLADPLKARMEANFTALGIPVAPPGCKVNAIDGLTIEQLGDYLTINALVEFKPDAGAQMPPDSILNLFTRTGSNPDAGPGLSKLDMAILSQSYAPSGNYSVGAVRSRIAREAVRVLDKEGLIKQDAKP